MQIVYAPLGLLNPRNPGRGFREFQSLGISDLVMDGALDEEPENPEQVEKLSEKKKEAAEEGPVDWPGFFRMGKEMAIRFPLAILRDCRVQQAKEKMALYASHGIGQVLLALEAEDVGREAYAEYLSALGECAAALHMQCLLKNQVHEVNGHFYRGWGSDALALNRFVDAQNEKFGRPVFGVCLDMFAGGACGQNMREWIRTVDPRLQVVIACDTDAVGYAHMLPFTGVSGYGAQTDWPEIIRGLREISFDGTLFIDAWDTFVAYPPFLRKDFLRMEKKTAEYLSWQITLEQKIRRYPSRVLFGAGRMCMRYMREYGEMYPPLFTCDNDAKIWGTEAYGLRVESPEALKELPAGCAIFICNMYYEEIEKQLRQMGLQNPIERFSDEIPPRDKLWTREELKREEKSKRIR